MTRLTTQPALRTAACLMPSKAHPTSGTSSTGWASTIRRLLPFQVSRLCFSVSCSCANVHRSRHHHSSYAACLHEGFAYHDRRLLFGKCMHQACRQYSTCLILLCVARGYGRGVNVPGFQALYDLHCLSRVVTTVHMLMTRPNIQKMGCARTGYHVWQKQKQYHLLV